MPLRRKEVNPRQRMGRLGTLHIIMVKRDNVQNPHPAEHPTSPGCPTWALTGKGGRDRALECSERDCDSTHISTLQQRLASSFSSTRRTGKRPHCPRRPCRLHPQLVALHSASNATRGGQRGRVAEKIRAPQSAIVSALTALQKK